MKFRYVTPALVGRWHETRDAAVEDAVRAGQAVLVNNDGELVWRDDAWLESEDGKKHPFRPDELHRC